jgi:phage N-6-adenine-methyltransferase
VSSTTPKKDRDLWATPFDVFAAIGLQLNIDIVHDVCAMRETSKCGSHYWGPDKGDDAMALDWCSELAKMHHAGGVEAVAVWMNPPYSNPTPWVRKASEEADKGLIVVGLVIHDPSTQWWQRHVERVASLAFVPDRRISFEMGGKRVAGNPKPSIFPVWTPWRTGQTQYVRFSLPKRAKR